jgi:hypothetical protein
MLYVPEQNSATGLENRTTVESTHHILYASGLRKVLLSEACNTTVYILNHTGPTLEEFKVPLKLRA